MLTEQQRNKVFIASLEELAFPRAIPVKFNAFDRLVQIAQNCSKNLYYYVMTLVFTWSVFFVSFKGFLLFAVMLGLVYFYISFADKAIKDAFKWYSFEMINTHFEVHSDGCVPHELDEFSCQRSAPLGDAVNVPVTGNEEFGSSIPSEVAESLLDSVDTDSSHLSMRVGDNGTGATESHSSVLGVKDTVGFVGLDLVVGGNDHVPKGNFELIDSHREGDIGLTDDGGVVGVETDLYLENREADGNIMSSRIGKDEVISSLSENMMIDYTANVYSSSFFVDVGKVSSDSETSLSKKVLKQDAAPRRSRNRVRRLARCSSGAPLCVRIRPLRRGRCSSFSSSLVEYMDVDSVEEMKDYIFSSSFEECSFGGEVDTCEPMDIDSFESDSTGYDQVLVEGEVLASFVGLPALGDGSFEPIKNDPQPCGQNFFSKDSVLDTSFSFAGKEKSIDTPVPFAEQSRFLIPPSAVLENPSGVKSMGSTQAEVILDKPATSASDIKPSLATSSFSGLNKNKGKAKDTNAVKPSRIPLPKKSTAPAPTPTPVPATAEKDTTLKYTFVDPFDSKPIKQNKKKMANAPSGANSSNKQLAGTPSSATAKGKEKEAYHEEERDKKERKIKKPTSRKRQQ